MTSNFDLAFASGSTSRFKQRLLNRMKALSVESGRDNFILPIGLFLLIDKANGGDATADELQRRFGLLDFESRKVIDFYFLGWDRSRDGTSISFDIDAFNKFRMSLRQAGVHQFGGNADLILVDAHYSPQGIKLDFSQAIRVDLSAASAEKDYPTLGHFLQSIIDAAEQVQAAADSEMDRPTFHISDRLGLAIAGKSILDYVFEKVGKVIGAKKLANVAVRRLGTNVDLYNL